MALLKDGMDIKNGSLDLRIYGNEPNQLSVLAATNEQSIVLKLTERQCVELARKLLNAVAIISIQSDEP